VISRASLWIRGAGLLALALATAELFLVSKGKWSDAIIDSGREWIVPDALFRGEMLYRDVVYWVGPFTPYVHAAWLRLFGSSYSTLAVAGACDSLAMLGALFLALWVVADRRQAAFWTALAIPIVVFMPASGGILIGMGYRHAATFALLALTLTSRGSAHGRFGELAVAGALCGLAGLCRTEWGIAAVAAAIAGITVRHRCFQDLRAILVVAVAALLTFGGVLAAFVAVAGFDPVIREGHLLLTGLPEETHRFMTYFSGVGNWRRGIPNILYSCSLWFTLFLLLRLLAEIKTNRAPAKRRIEGLLLALLLLGVSAAIGGASGPFLWSGAPGLCLFSILVGIRRGNRRDSASLVSFGLMGLLTSHRRLFHIGDSWYVGNPLVFTFVCAATLLRLAILSERQLKTRSVFQDSISWTLAILTILAFGMRVSQYRSDQRVAIAGTGGLLSAPAEVASSIETLAEAIRTRTRAGEGLVVFPEGEILNYLSGRPNPCRHKMYLPGYLTEANEEELLQELERRRPAAIVVLPRPTSEYGPMFFGEDYGKRISAWIGINYEPAWMSAGYRRRMVFYLIRSRLRGGTNALSAVEASSRPIPGRICTQ
jgi:hypothetical protein